MDKPTNCSIDGCTHPVRAKRLCNGHYKRQSLTGTTARPCPTCGADLPVTKGIKFCSDECAARCEVHGCDRRATAGVTCHAHATRKSRTGSYERLCEGCGKDIPITSFAKRFCSVECGKRICSTEGCGKAAKSGGLCAAHYWRVRSNGSPHRACKACGATLTVRLGQTVYCSKECQPKCWVTECRRGIYRAGLCDAHYALSRPNTPTWIGSLKSRDFASGCRSCGYPMGDGGTFCSDTCYAYHYRHGDEVREHLRTCKACGEEFSLLDGSGNKRRPLTTALCLSCKRRKNNYRKHAATLMAASNGKCALCAEAIDLTIRFPDPLSMSIDHIQPWSMGGSDDLENLQVAHLRCNNRKNAQVAMP